MMGTVYAWDRTAVQVALNSGNAPPFVFKCCTQRTLERLGVAVVEAQVDEADKDGHCVQIGN